MVVRHTIHKLRQRPEEERAAFATAVAIGIAVLLFLGWVVYFLASLDSVAPDSSVRPTQQTQSASSDQSAASNQPQSQAVEEATSDPYQVTTTSWGN
ncbi:MAG TPA: hypothetical protein VMU25_01955 [Candidatus Paceibacterota bacterium]|nr:hypothetical protein [Candidatus Paceibacterota bacterium]